MNTNCLEGIRCPCCGNTDSFSVEATALFLVLDEGASSCNDIDWDGGSRTICRSCDHAAPWREFDTSQK